MTFGASYPDIKSGVAKGVGSTVYPNVKKERGCKGVGSTANDFSGGNMTWGQYPTRPKSFSTSFDILFDSGRLALGWKIRYETE